MQYFVSHRLCQSTLCASFVLLLLVVVTPLCAQRPSFEHFELQHLDARINTPGSEAGVTLLDDTLLLFTSYRPITLRTVVYRHSSSLSTYRFQLCEASVDRQGNPSRGRVSDRFPIDSRLNVGNAAFDARHDILFFTVCDLDDSLSLCALYAMSRRHGRWSRPRRLPAPVNIDGFSSSQPAVASLSDSTTLLLFSSNRPDTFGGFDLFAVPFDGSDFGSVFNLGPSLNTTANELTPFFFDDRIFFSSDRPGGFGGLDVYYADFPALNNHYAVSHLDSSINSRFDDGYFMVLPAGNCGFLASNRMDAFVLTDSACCTDLYRWSLPRHAIAPLPTRQPSSIPSVAIPPLVPVAKTLLPIKLYFDNDSPLPNSTATTTSLTYLQTYNAYMFRRPDYHAACDRLSDPLLRDSSHAAVDLFFDDQVSYGANLLQQFIPFLADDMAAGRRVCLTVAGFASQLHTSAYNQALSQRRIASIVNQFRSWNGGQLARFIDRGQLIIRQSPYGSSHSTPLAPSHIDAAVYSLSAASDRRVEIIDYQYVD